MFNCLKAVYPPPWSNSQFLRKVNSTTQKWLADYKPNRSFALTLETFGERTFAASDPETSSGKTEESTCTRQIKLPATMREQIDSQPEDRANFLGASRTLPQQRAAEKCENARDSQTREIGGNARVTLGRMNGEITKANFPSARIDNGVYSSTAV